MPRALFVSYTGLAGGAERLLVDVARRLDPPPLVACPPGPLADAAAEAGLRVFPLRQRPLELRGEQGRAALRLAAHSRELARLARAVRPDALVAWGMRTMLAAAPLRGVRVVFQHNDFLPPGAAGRAVRAATGKAERVVCVSRAVADDLGRPAEVVHPGVDLEAFSPATAGEHALLLGAIVGWKRPELALEATREAGVALRVAGEPLGPEGEEIAAALSAGGAELVGRVDPAPELAAAACLIHCSDREPWGMALVEALASGTPVVAPASGGPAEIVTTECGALYPPGDARAAAAALREVIARRAELGPAARTRAERQFDIRATAARYEALLPAAPSEDGRELSFVTVTHDSAGELGRLLRSVARHLPAAEVIVVDSGSGDESAEVARAGGARVTELGENVGFGRASNTGVGLVTRPVTVLINPDCELVDGSLAALGRASAPEQIMVPRLVLPDGSLQDAAQAEPATARTALAALVPPGALPRRLAEWAEPWRARSPRTAGWGVGACLVARTETLRRLGPFDEDIFMFAEDLDLGLRARDEGVAIEHRPEAGVLHGRAHSTTRAYGGEPYELLARRRRETVERRRGRARRAADDAIQALTFADRIALKAIVGRDSSRERRQLRALRKAVRGR